MALFQEYKIITYDIPEDSHLPKFGIHQVFYDEVGKPVCISEEPLSLTGENKDDIIEFMEEVLSAVKHSAPFVVPENADEWGELTDEDKEIYGLEE